MGTVTAPTRLLREKKKGRKIKILKKKQPLLLALHMAFFW
jgi:hypothetical protein